MKSYFTILICILFLSSCSTEQKIYVSPTGSDANSGTENSPIASLNLANKKAKELAKNGAVTIYLMDGIHYISEPLTHTSDDTKNQNNPIKYIALHKGEATISTATVLKNLKWEKYDDNILKTKISDDILIKELYVNGEKQHIARYPNYDSKVRHFNGYSEDAIDPERVKTWSNPQGGIIHAMHVAEWGGYQYVIKDKKDNGELVLDGGFQNNRQMGMHAKYRMVENIFEELDVENEWFFDASTKTLYYYPPANLNLETVIIEVPQLESIFEMRGKSDSPIKNISIEGLVLRQTLPTYMKTNEMLLRSDWAIHRGASVYFEHSENCSISECVLTDIGGNAIFFSEYNNNCVAEKNHIYNIGASGICFVGSPDAVRSPSFHYSEFVPYEEMDLEKGPKTNNFPSSCVADNNLIHNIGRVEKQVAGVQISMSRGIKISHNSIYNTPRSGINVSEGTWGGHIIEGNDVFNTVLETGDHGSFNSWGRDRFWHPNRNEMDLLTEKHPELILLDAMETTIMRNNRWQCYHGWDIDLDDGSSNYHIYNNLCLNGGIKLREGFHRTVENNITVNNSFHPHVWFQNSNDVFRHNIVSQDYKPIMVKAWGDEIDYNLFINKEGLEMAQKEGIDKNSIYGDPLFIDPAKGDYRVQDDSPALKIGFKNFDMDNFGVQYPPLKAIAETPILPEFTVSAAERKMDEIYDWLGAKVKTMTTVGEQSASGMYAITGVIILELSEDSPLKKAGVQTTDVIIELNQKKIPNWSALEKATKELGTAKKFTLSAFRNQVSNAIEVSL